MNFKVVSNETRKVVGYVEALTWEAAEIFVMNKYDMFITDFYAEYDLVLEV